MAENNEQITVQAELRNDRGKNDSRRLRQAGRIPVTIYGGEGVPVAATAKLSDLAAIIRTRTGVSTIFKVAIDGMDEAEVMFHDRQIDSVKGRMIHADLKRIVRGQKLVISVPLELTGEPAGIKEGGLLDHVLHQVEIRCRPSQIPESIKADVSGLHVNEVLHISDLTFSEDVEVMDDPKLVVATVKYAKPDDEGITPSTVPAPVEE